jgi:UDP-2,3-diacylglucosamine hydrolase
MRLFFISDLHLKSQEDPVALALCDFLRLSPHAGDYIVLGGDIFDLFVGNKQVFKEHFAEVLNAIGSAARIGAKVHYFEGNHDFQLEEVFSHLGVQIHARDFALEINGKKIWISHGDEIDKQDYGYRVLRAVTRSWPLRLLIRAFPEKLLAKLGAWSSRQSRKYNNTESLPLERLTRTKTLFRDYAAARIEQDSADYVFIGHSHQADDMVVGNGRYINLGFSSEKLLYAELDLDRNHLSLQSYTASKAAPRGAWQPDAL